MDFKTILGLPDKDAITALIVKKEVNEVIYERPSEWFAYLERVVNLGCPTGNATDRQAEAKLSRDVLVHNKGVANKIDESKAGNLARFHDGDRIDIPEFYHRETWELICKVVTDSSNAASAKT